MKYDSINIKTPTHVILLKATFYYNGTCIYSKKAQRNTHGKKAGRVGIGLWRWFFGLVGHLEALPVDNGGASLIVLLFANPHLLEGGQRSQDGATDPDGVFPLRGSDNLGRKRFVRQYCTK